MIKLGELKKRQRYEIVRFKDWVNKGEMREKEGEYPVYYIIPPSKYPSGALMFYATDNGLRLIKLTVKRDTLKEIAKLIGLRKGNDAYGKQIWFILKENGEYGVDIREGDGGYIWTGKSWKWLDEKEIAEMKEQEDEYDL